MTLFGLHADNAFHVFGSLTAFSITLVMLVGVVIYDMKKVRERKKMYFGQRDHYVIGTIWTALVLTLLTCIVINEEVIDGIRTFTQMGKFNMVWLAAMMNIALTFHIGKGAR